VSVSFNFCFSIVNLSQVWSVCVRTEIITLQLRTCMRSRFSWTSSRRESYLRNTWNIRCFNFPQGHWACTHTHWENQKNLMPTTTCAPNWLSTVAVFCPGLPPPHKPKEKPLWDVMHLQIPTWAPDLYLHLMWASIDLPQIGAWQLNAANKRCHFRECEYAALKSNQDKFGANLSANSILIR